MSRLWLCLRLSLTAYNQLTKVNLCQYLYTVLHADQALLLIRYGYVHATCQLQQKSLVCTIAMLLYMDKCIALEN